MGVVRIPSPGLSQRQAVSTLPMVRPHSLNLGVASLGRVIDCTDHSGNFTLYARPTCRTQCDNRNASHCKILLIPQIPVGRDEDVETFPFRRIEQFAVLQGRPAAFIGGRNFVLRQ